MRPAHHPALFVELVRANDEDRAPILKRLVEQGYPSLFRSEINLAAITAGQFDEHIREEYNVNGSTVDKIAAFFISIAKAAGISLSPHLLQRRPVASSSSSKKSAKQRRRDNGEARTEAEGEAPLGGRVNPTPPQKELEYQLIDLMSESDIDDSVKQSIWSLVQYLTARKARMK
jgi:hypothetical protein